MKLKNRISRWLVSGVVMLSITGPMVSDAGAQYHHDRRYYYRDSRGRWHKRHSGIGPGKGALIGGAAGTGIGALVGSGKGALIGGAIGAGGGALAGKANADRRHDDQRRYDEYGHPR